MGGATAPTLTPTVNGHDVTEPTPITKPAKAKQGTRLPDDWEPSAEDIAFARSLRHITDSAIAREALKFKNHWLSMPGHRGVKLNWSLAWQNWVVRATEYALKDRNRQRRADKSILDIHQRIHGQREPDDE